VEVFFLEWDEENEAHLAEHGLTPRLINQMLANRHLTKPNRKEEGRVLLIGETHGGEVMTISLAPTNDPGTWRPVTGWRAVKSERKLFDDYCR
jgi:uncharacterized DUF497 family protein